MLQIFIANFPRIHSSTFPHYCVVPLIPAKVEKMMVRSTQVLLSTLLWNCATKFALGDLSYEDKLYGLSMVGRNCPLDCTFNSTSPAALHQDNFITRIDSNLKSNGMGLVSSNRIRATALLTKSAILSCTPGDIVETGVFSGGSSAMIMKVLMNFDLCNRKFWVFDSFEGK